MKFERFDHIVFGLLGSLVFAIAVVLLRGDRVGVRLVRVSPENGGVVGAQGPIILDFADSMNRESVEASFVLEPVVEGHFEWAGNSLYFWPQQAFKQDLSYELQLREGAETARGTRLEQELNWRFEVREAVLAYMREEDEGRSLWVLPEVGGRPLRLTEAGQHVFNFAVAPSGEQIVYALVNEEQGIDLYSVNREGGEQRMLVDCGLDRCASPAWSPNEQQIAFVRSSVGLEPGDPYSAPRIWIYDVRTGMTQRLHADTQKLGYGPHWSPDGSWLSYSDGVNDQIALVDMEDGSQISLASNAGTVGSWAADSRGFIYETLIEVDEKLVFALYQAELDPPDTRALFDPQPRNIEFRSPVWGPQGVWIAVLARELEGSPGNQVWLLNQEELYSTTVDGEEGYSHADLSWEASGERLLFSRVQLGVAHAASEVLVWDQEGRELRIVLEGVLNPRWLP